MRVAVCEVLGEILVRVLCGDGLDESGKADRDRFFDTLQEHLHDVHSHVRARVLQVYARIVNSKVGPLYCNAFLNAHCQTAKQTMELSVSGPSSVQVQRSNGPCCGTTHGQVHKCSEECHPTSGRLYCTQSVQLQGNYN